MAAVISRAAALRSNRVLRRAVQSIMIETLEQRRLLSASLINVSNWVAQGPGPVSNSGFQQVGTVEELAADPTNANILYATTSAAAALLTLTNYTGIATLQVSALDGNDVINLYTAPAAVSRSFLIDGGSPTAKKRLTDQLNVFYVNPKPRIMQSKTTQSPQSGLINLDYGSSNTLVQFTDVEDFVIRKS